MDEKPKSPIPALSDLSGGVVGFGLSAEQATDAFARLRDALKKFEEDFRPRLLPVERKSARPWYRRGRW